MAKIIGFINQKGGVGKTTSTINVARYLVDLGKRVLLVDLDPQGNASSGLGIDARRQEKNLYHAMTLGLPPEEIIVATETENFHVIKNTTHCWLGLDRLGRRIPNRTQRNPQIF